MHATVSPARLNVEKATPTTARIIPPSVVSNSRNDVPGDSEIVITRAETVALISPQNRGSMPSDAYRDVCDMVRPAVKEQHSTRGKDHAPRPQ